MYKLKFMFDWGSGICLWSNNEESMNKFGDYPIDTRALPISEKLKTELEHLIDWHDEALNWDDPSSDLLWDDSQIQNFLTEAKKAYRNLCNEMGEDYEIEFFDKM